MAGRKVALEKLSKQGMREHLGGDAIGRFRRFGKSAEFVGSNARKLAAQYNRAWVGVHNGAVVVHGDTLEDVIAQLRAKKIDPNETLVEFVDKDGPRIIL